MTKKKNKQGISFKKYLNIFLIIVTFLVAGLVYFINILPLEYFIVFIVLLILIDAIAISLLNSNGPIKRMLGGLFTIVLIILMIMGINYELNTIDFFKQFGFNAYKTENYNLVVLKNTSDDIKKLEGETVGHLDTRENKGLSKAIDKLLKKVEFKSKVYDSIDALATGLINEECYAILIEDAQMDIIKEENNDLYEKFKIINKIQIDIKTNNIGKSVKVTEDSFNILISGIDTYGSITKVSRSDVNILLSVNPNKHQILITSIPRDYYVLLPSFNSYDKLTHAGIYGIEESVKTVENLLDVQINYYVKVNFTSLIDLVDAFDGIEVDSKYEFTTQDGYTFKKGINKLNGKEALSFSRERKSFSMGDRVRGENQELVLTALINKALSPKIITNYTEILKALKNKFVTNFTNEEITSLIKRQINEKDTWGVKSISLDGSDSYDYTYSYKKQKLYVMKPNSDSIKKAKNEIEIILSN